MAFFRRGRQERPGKPAEESGAQSTDPDRREAELELYRETESGPFNRDPERWFNRGHNSTIDYEKDEKDKY